MSTWKMTRLKTPDLAVFMAAVVLAQFRLSTAYFTVMVIFSETTGGLWGM